MSFLSIFSKKLLEKAFIETTENLDKALNSNPSTENIEQLHCDQTENRNSEIRCKLLSYGFMAKMHFSSFVVKT